MGITRPLATALHAALLASVAVLATGCMSGVRADIDASMREARAELHDDPLDLRADGRPDAAITPRGVFEIGGKPVPTDAAQQAAVRAYRDAMIAYGDAVLDVAARETGPLVSRSLRHAWFGVLTGREAAADRHHAFMMLAGIGHVDKREAHRQRPDPGDQQRRDQKGVQRVDQGDAHRQPNLQSSACRLVCGPLAFDSAIEGKRVQPIHPKVVAGSPNGCANLLGDGVKAAEIRAASPPPQPSPQGGGCCIVHVGN